MWFTRKLNKEKYLWNRWIKNSCVVNMLCKWTFAIFIFKNVTFYETKSTFQIFSIESFEILWNFENFENLKIRFEFNFAIFLWNKNMLK